MHDQPHLTFGAKVGYAAAELGINTVETVLRIYLLVFYTSTVGLAAPLAGLAAALAIAWDAVTDPLMGIVSDRTQHRFGGRRGYLPVGAALLAGGVVLVFHPPVLVSQPARFAWLLGSYCLLNTAMTVLSVPYTAMAGELTEDPYDRAVLFGWRFAFANVGALLAAALPLVFLAPGGSNAATMPAVSAVAAALVLGTAAISHRATRSAPRRPVPARREPLLSAFHAPLRNPAFRPLLLAYVLANTGIGVNAATFLFYYEHHLRLPAAETQGVLAVFLLVFTVSILGWVRLSRRCGKRRPLIAGAVVLGVGTPLLYVLVPPGGFWWVMGAGAIGLGSFVGSIVLIDAMLTDVLDHDQLRTRAAHAGSFFGVWRLASKLARALSVASVGAVLGLAGFVEQAGQQPPGVDTALVMLFGPGVGAFFLLAAFVLWRHRFREPQQARVRRLLARRAVRVTG